MSVRREGVHFDGMSSGDSRAVCRGGQYSGLRRGYVLGGERSRRIGQCGDGGLQHGEIVPDPVKQTILGRWRIFCFSATPTMGRCSRW